MKRLHLINAIGEAVIPLLGIIFWDWGLYFILLFYFIDLISTEVFCYLKVRKIVQFQQIKFPFSTRYGRLILNSVLVLCVLIISNLAIYFISPQIQYYEEFVAFLKYTEVGFPIPQGYILLPLVVLGNYSQYNTLFIKTGLYRRISWRKLILTRRKALTIAISGGVISILIAYFIQMPEIIYVLSIVAIKFYMDLYLTVEKTANT